jgi:signal transduction histidine kinase
VTQSEGWIGRLPRELETAIFRAVQECLRNVHGHSGSRTAAVRITNVSNELRVEVEDAGKGIPSGTQEAMSDNRCPVIGMSGMRERLRQFAGRREIISATGRTVVAATVPMPFT